MKDLLEFLDKYNIVYTVDGNSVIAGDVYVENEGITSLPVSIGNLECQGLYLRCNNLTSLPESIGNLKCRYLDLQCNNLTSLPESIGNLTCEYLYLRSNNLTSRPDVRHFGEFEVTDEYIYCDGTLTWYSRKKAFSNYTVYVGYFGDYVVVDGDKNCAHGNSIRQCIADITFKKSDRDSSEYKGTDMDEQYPLMECIVMYRSITGACSGGVEMFMQKQKEIKDAYSVNELIGITVGNYGHDQFVQFFDEES